MHLIHKSVEFDVRQWLSHSIHNHYSSEYITKLNLFYNNFIPDIVMLDINILYSYMKDAIIYQYNRTLVVIFE